MSPELNVEENSTEMREIVDPQPRKKELLSGLLVFVDSAISGTDHQSQKIELWPSDLIGSSSIPIVDRQPIHASTVAHYVYEDKELVSRIESIISLAAGEDLRDGIYSETARALCAYIESYPVNGVLSLLTRLRTPDMNQVVVADIVRALGQIQDPISFLYRVNAAERLLHSKSPIARDIAAVTLVEVESVRSIPSLEQVIEVEPIRN